MPGCQYPGPNLHRLINWLQRKNDFKGIDSLFCLLFQVNEGDFNTCSCLRQLYLEAAVNDYVIKASPHHDYTLMEAIVHQIHDEWPETGSSTDWPESVEDLVEHIVEVKSYQISQNGMSAADKTNLAREIDDVQYGIFVSAVIFPYIVRSHGYKIYLYHSPGFKQEICSTPEFELGDEPAYIILGVSNHHFVSMKNVGLCKSLTDDCLEIQVLQHFQDQAATDRQAETVGYPQESCLQLEDIDQIYSVAPAEGNMPRYVLENDDFEELCFPDKFPYGKGGFKKDQKRQRKLSRRRYVNQRLLNVDPRFRQDLDYLFATQYLCDLEQVQVEKRIALKRTKGNVLEGKKVTAKTLKDPESMEGLIQSDRAYECLKKQRGGPPYLQVQQRKAFAMVKQLGIPTWFLSLSAADLYWPEFLRAIAIQDGKSYTEEQVMALTWQERCDLIRHNPVTAIRMFYHRINAFFTHFIHSSAQPLGHITDLMAKVEYQGRGTPHLHSLLWEENAPQYIEGNEENNDIVCRFIDKYISGKIPENDDHLRELVTTLQAHKHSNYCRRDGKCRFGKPDPPSNKTVIAEKPEDDKKIKDAQKLLEKVMKVFLSGEEPIELDELLKKAEVSETDYAVALTIAHSGHHIVLNKAPKDSYINNYNPDVLKAWEANTDLQYCLDPYSVIVYLLSYMLKDENAMGDLLRRVSKEIKDENIRKQMNVISAKFFGTREVCAQASAMNALSLKMFWKSRADIFVTTEPKESRVRMTKPTAELDLMEDDDDDIFVKGLHEKYSARPESMEDVCLASFAVNYTYHSTAR